VRRFEATVSRNESGGHAVAVPLDSREAFGSVRAPVRATVNGYTFRTRLARYGGIDYLGFNREVREAAGIADGDRLAIEVELDEEPRPVAVPDELAQAWPATRRREPPSVRSRRAISASARGGSPRRDAQRRGRDASSRR
jgi:hypothetical protein